VPILVLILVKGNINLLGDLYAFGLLGAFTLTCLGLDIVRHRERKLARSLSRQLQNGNLSETNREKLAEDVLRSATPPNNGATSGAQANLGGIGPEDLAALATPATSWRVKFRDAWHSLDFWLGILTTLLVFIAWSTNLVSKPLATLFGGSVAAVGMLVAYGNYMYHKQRGRVPVMITGVEGRLPGSILAVLTSRNGHNDAVIRAALNHVDGHPVVFLYMSDYKPQRQRTPDLFEVVDPYLDDSQAKEYFGKAESLAQKAKVPRRFVYRQQEPNAVARVWQAVHPHDTVVAAENAAQFEDINPDRIRYELTTSGKVAHMLKQW